MSASNSRGLTWVGLSLSLPQLAALTAVGLCFSTLIFAIWTATSPWDFPRFVASVVLLVYMPGKLVLDSGGIRLSPLEDLALSLVVGMTLSSLLYWIAAFLHLPYAFVLWPVAALASWFYRRRTKLRWAWKARFRVDGTHFLLLGVLALQLIPLAALPMYYQNVASLPEGGLSFLDRPKDAIFHLSIANELKHSIPPSVPYLAGQPLGYHYGMDLLTAMLSKVGGLSILDLTARFTPTLLLITTTLAVFCFARAWLRSGYGAVLGAFLVILGEDLSFIPGLLLGSEEVWSVHFFGAPTVYSLYFMNPMLPALGILFAGMFCLLRYYENGAKTWLLLTAFLFAIAMEYKIFVTAQVLIVLAIGALTYLLLFRDSKLLRVLILTVLVAIPLGIYGLLGTEAGTRVWVRLDPWPYIPVALEQLGLLDTFLGSRVDALYTGAPALVGLLAFALVALPAYLIGSLGFRSLAIPVVLKDVFAPSSSSALRLVLGLLIIVGAVMALTISVTPWGYPAESEYNEAIWFYVLSKYVASILAVEVVLLLLRGRQLSWQALVVGAILAVSLPSTAQFFQTQRSYGLDVITENELDLMGFLDERCSSGEVVLSRQRVAARVAAVTRCRVPVLNIGAYTHSFVSMAGLAERRADRDDFWEEWNEEKLRTDILERYRISYVVVDRRLGDRVPASRFWANAGEQPVVQLISIEGFLENEDFVVYQVSRDDEETG